MLDEALELARQERAALENANYEEAIELAGRRGELTGMAWSLLARETMDDYGSARNDVRQSLNHARREQRRIRGYHQAVGHALQ